MASLRAHPIVSSSSPWKFPWPCRAACCTNFQQCCRGRTGLFFAAQNGHKKVAELLLEKGADVNTKENLFGLGLGMSSSEDGRWFGLNETSFSADCKHVPPHNTFEPYATHNGGGWAEYLVSLHGPISIQLSFQLPFPQFHEISWYEDMQVATPCKIYWLHVPIPSFSCFFSFTSILLTIFGNAKLQWIEATSHAKVHRPHIFD